MPAPYRYDTPTNPFADSIGALLLRRGDIDAQRAGQIAAAQAHAAEVSGAAWGGAARDIGQVVSALPAQMEQQRRAALQDDATKLQLDEAKRTQRARSVLGEVVTSTPHVDEDGVSLYDIPAITKKLEAAGFGDHVGDVASQLNGLNTAFRTERQAKMALVQRGAQALMQANGDPDLTLHFLDTLEKNGTFGASELDPYRHLIAKDPTKTMAVLQQFAGPAKVVMGAAGSTPVNEFTGKPVGDALPKPPTAEDALIDSYIGSLKAPAGTTWDALTPEQKAAFPAWKQEQSQGPVSLQSESDWEMDGKPVPVLFNPRTGTRSLAPGGPDVSAQLRKIPPASVTIREGGAENRSTLAQMVRDGRMAPSLLSRRGDYNDIIAEADKQNRADGKGGLNINRLENEYAAAKKWVQVQNGPQMVKFKGLAASVVNTIDEVKDLGDQLKQGSIQKWNSVSRKTVQQLYGNTPQSELANRYMIAVNTLKEEFANLANGGYAPTEAAWGLANSQINGDYGFKDLGASLSEVQRLINYRVNALEDVAPVSAPTPAAAPTAGSPPIQVGGFTVTVH